MQELPATRPLLALALVGSSRVGKSALLRQLAQAQTPPLRCVYIPVPTLPLDELCQWSLQSLGAVTAGSTESQLVALAKSAAGDRGGILLLIDDAHSLPLETACGLAALQRRAGGAIGVVLAAYPRAPLPELLEALGTGAPIPITRKRWSHRALGEIEARIAVWCGGTATAPSETAAPPAPRAQLAPETQWSEREPGSARRDWLAATLLALLAFAVSLSIPAPPVGDSAAAEPAVSIARNSDEAARER